MRLPAVALSLAILSASCSPTSEQPAEKPAAKADSPTTYLASITVPLTPDDRLESFSFDTWGARILAVCHIPPGWRITAGGSAAPDGVIAGQASHGVTWLNDTKPLENLVLVSLYGQVRQADEGNVPATFKGKAVLEGSDHSREVALTHANIRLSPADRCPLLP